MTVKKVAIIAAAGAVLLAGALTLSMTLITRNKYRGDGNGNLGTK